MNLLTAMDASAQTEGLGLMDVGAIPRAASPVPPVSPVSTVAPADDVASRMRRMFEAHYDFVWRSLLRLGVSKGAVDDAAQKVFLVATRRIDQIQPTKEASFLFGVALRLASEERRSQTRRREVADDEVLDAQIDAGPSPEELLQQHQARAIVDEVLDGMPFEARTVFVLVELEGMSLPEVSELLSLPLGTATSRLRRARELFGVLAKRARARLVFSGGER